MRFKINPVEVAPMWREKTVGVRKYRTWLAVWLDMNKLSTAEFAKIMMCHPMRVTEWCAGETIGSHNARLMRAWFPDAPVGLRTAPVVPISQPLPANSRSIKMYKFILKIAKIVPEVHPDALARARGIHT